MKPHYYVYALNYGAPTVRHATLAEAQAEAERLAEKHSGRAFEILKCVGHSSTRKAITFWMDGEGPPHPLGANASGLARDEAEETPEKPRYRMIDEGESIEDGDEFSRGFHWMPSQCAGQKYTKVMHQPHRRPL